jgi:hypothetical protein
MQDRALKEVKVMTRQLGVMRNINSTIQAAEFIVNERPGVETEKLETAKHALIKCYDGHMSPGVARMPSLRRPKKRKSMLMRPGVRNQPASLRSGARVK